MHKYIIHSSLHQSKLRIRCKVSDLRRVPTPGLNGSSSSGTACSTTSSHVIRSTGSVADPVESKTFFALESESISFNQFVRSSNTIQRKLYIIYQSDQIFFTFLFLGAFAMLSHVCQTQDLNSNFRTGVYIVHFYLPPPPTFKTPYFYNSKGGGLPRFI